MKKMTVSRTLWGALLIASLLLAACGQTPAPPPTEAPSPVAGPTTVAPTMTTEPGPPEQETAAPSPEPTEPPGLAGLGGVDTSFALYDEPAVRVEPAVSHEPISPDLSNVRVPFALSDGQIERLARDGFVITPGSEREFFTVYEQARYANAPIFVTSDSLLHTYHLLFDKVLRTAEEQAFIPLLRDLNHAVMERAEAQYGVLQGTAWEDAARRTVAFVAVAGRLLEPDFPVPDYAAELVEAELALVDEAAGMLESPIFPGLEYGEDYTQYIPRGHYTRSETLEAYFRSMMWYGRMTFRLETDDPEVGRAETRSALLLVHALRNADIGYKPALDVWADLYYPTVFFVGRSDDLTVLQYLDVIDEVYGASVSTASLADDALLDEFIAQAKELPAPRILGMVIDYFDDEEKNTKGLRLMGQRFVPDAYIFRQLMWRNVGTVDNPRILPKGLDLLAAMGSERAYDILDEMGETQYENYTGQMAKVQAWVLGLSVDEWTETLYNTWLYSFQPLLDVPGEGYPAFMQSPAWVDKQLHTVLGSWTELKHDTILYAKQAYAEMGDGGGPPEPVPPLGYVEPVPEFYARLAALTAMTRQGLGDRGLLDSNDAFALQRLEELARMFLVISEKELRGEPLEKEEYDLIRFYGGELEHLLRASVTTDEGEPPGGAGFFTEEELQAAVVADVATDPASGTVLEEGVGRVDEIHVVVPMVDDDGSTYLQVAKGGVFSYYEFAWPMDDRLTDEKWRAMLDAGEAPERPGWIESFFTIEGEESDLTQAVFSFQRSLAEVFWWLMPEYAGAEGAALAQLTAAAEALLANNQYMGHQLLRSEFRSFDRQSDGVAVVTVRETWQDALYTYEEGGSPGNYPYEEDEISGERGPYTLDVTYTLERGEWAWVVTRIVYANEPPAW